jgi:hypothetical protein
MYLEYLTDPIGGPAVFDPIQAGKPGAWMIAAVVLSFFRRNGWAPLFAEPLVEEFAAVLAGADDTGLTALGASFSFAQCSPQREPPRPPVRHHKYRRCQ